MEVKLPVSRMNQACGWRIHDDSHRIWNVVVDVEEGHLKFSKLDTVFHLQVLDVELWRIEVGLTLADNAVRHWQSIQWRVPDLWQDVRNGSNVVIVTVGDNYSADLLFLPLEVGHVRNDVVHSGHVLFRELQSHVDQDDVVPVLQQRTVTTHLFTSTEHDGTQDAFCWWLDVLWVHNVSLTRAGSLAGWSASVWSLSVVALCRTFLMMPLLWARSSL